MTLQRALGALVLLVVFCAAPLHAAQPGATSSSESDGLVTDLNRIKTALRAEEPIQLRGLRFTQYAEVRGRAPKFDLFQGTDLTSEAVRYGSPTHEEMVSIMTPRNFRVRGMNVTGMLERFTRWLRRKR